MQNKVKICFVPTPESQSPVTMAEIRALLHQSFNNYFLGLEKSFIFLT